MKRQEASRKGRSPAGLNVARKVALSFLLQAHRDAEGRSLSVWEFAVEIDALERQGVTVNDIRALLADGYIQHRVETTGWRSRRRMFDEVHNSALSARSCFVLSPHGILLMEQMKTDAIIFPSRQYALPAVNGDVTPPAPYWDAYEWVLRYGNWVIKRFKRHARNQEAILTEFQRRSWKYKIDNPLRRMECINRKLQLRDTVKNLNLHHQQIVLRFHAADCGHFVTWERLETSST